MLKHVDILCFINIGDKAGVTSFKNYKNGVECKNSNCAK